MRPHDALARERCNRFTTAAILAMVTMLFAAFTGAYLIRRTGSDWKPVELPGILRWTTFVIVCSSITMELARRATSPRWLATTCGLAT